ncbi:hypothetical protein V8C86DRAFT_1167602 [Haematococcus lacustris]
MWQWEPAVASLELASWFLLCMCFAGMTYRDPNVTLLGVTVYFRLIDLSVHHNALSCALVTNVARAVLLGLRLGRTCSVNMYGRSCACYCASMQGR